MGIVGAGYIAGVHSAAYRTAPGTFADSQFDVELAAVADSARGRAESLSRSWGWRRIEADWRAITEDEHIDVVDICVPNDLHAEIAIDALRHGKHVLCEKPLAQNVANAHKMAEAAKNAQGLAQVCFYYRLWPAITLAAETVRAGKIGRILYFRGWMLQDYAADPSHQLGWRASPRDAGAGALADLGSHIIDIAQHFCGQIRSVNALTSSFVERAAEAPPIDDHATLLVEFHSGASGVIEASWAMRGHRCDLGFDLVGDRGAIRFSWERANELEVLVDNPTDRLAGFRRVLIGGGSSDAGRFVAVPGQGLGYRDAFTIGLGHLLSAICAESRRVEPSFGDGLQVARVVEAALHAHSAREWTPVAVPGEIEI